MWKVFEAHLSSSFLSDGYPTILELKEFIETEQKQLSGMAKVFKTTIQDTLEYVISATLSDGTSEEQRKSHKQYQKMVELTTRMLHTVLVSIVGNTIDSYNSAFKKYLDVKTAVFRIPQFHIQF
jgi:hypothetical protein